MNNSYRFGAYVVLWIKSGHIAYAGPCEVNAAQALEPGTTYGTGWSHEGALKEAMGRRDFHTGAMN